MILTRRQVETILVIGLGGFIGANMRYLMAGLAVQWFGKAFPWGTLIINVSGSCFLAAFTAWAVGRLPLDSPIRLLIAVGFCGAYTTFSTYAVESIALLQAGQWLTAAANIVGSNLMCLIGVVIGLAIGSRL